MTTEFDPLVPGNELILNDVGFRLPSSRNAATESFHVLKDGTYRAWFTTPLGQGTGIAHVAGDKIWGCDSLMNYSGTCHVDGERFTAVVHTKRHTPDRPTMFGADHAKLVIEGTCDGKIGRYVATAEEAPGIFLDGTLIRSEDESLAQGPATPEPAFDPGKLRKLPRPRTR